MSFSDERIRESLEKVGPYRRFKKRIEDMDFGEVLNTRENLHRYNWAIFNFPVIRRNSGGLVAQVAITDGADQLVLIDRTSADDLCYETSTAGELKKGRVRGVFEGVPYDRHPKVWPDSRLYKLLAKMGGESGRYVELTFSTGHDTDVHLTDLVDWKKAKSFIEEHGTGDYVLEINRPGPMTDFVFRARHIEMLDTHDPGYRGYRTYEEVCKELEYITKLLPECRKRHLLRLVELIKARKKKEGKQ